MAQPRTTFFGFAPMLGRRRIQLVAEAGFLGMNISLVLGMEVKELKDHDDE